VFVEAYGQIPSNNIVLQDLSRGDLDTYISGKLENHRRFKKLAGTDGRAPGFATEIRYV
jgi:hypothetical protein